MLLPWYYAVQVAW